MSIRWLAKILRPPVKFRWIFGVVSLLADAAIFARRLHKHPAAYVIFTASALGFYYLITVTLVPAVRALRRFLCRYTYIRRYYEDSVFRSRVLLYSGLCFNILYALFKFVTGVYFRSTWLIAISSYYLILILIKGLLVRRDVRHLRNGKRAEQGRLWKDYRRTGWMLLLLNIGLSGLVIQVVHDNKSFEYPGALVFAFAAYTFYRVIVVTVRILKNRAQGEILLYAARAIDLCFAVTSLFTLQTAMFASFSPDMDVRGPNIITGTGVAVFITATALFMIIRSGKWDE